MQLALKLCRSNELYLLQGKGMQHVDTNNDTEVHTQMWTNTQRGTHRNAHTKRAIRRGWSVYSAAMTIALAGCTVTPIVYMVSPKTNTDGVADGSRPSSEDAFVPVAPTSNPLDQEAGTMSRKNQTGVDWVEEPLFGGTVRGSISTSRGSISAGGGSNPATHAGQRGCGGSSVSGLAL